MVVSELKALAKKMKLKMPVSVRKSDMVELLAAAFRKNGKPVVIRNEKNELTVKSVKKNSASSKPSTDRQKPSTRKELPAAKPSVPKPTVDAPPVGREWKMPPGAEEPIMAQERVSDAKFYTGPQKEQATNAPYVELPTGYGEEKIALMVRDPYLAYVYWELTPSRIEREKTWFGWNGKLTVRLYDVTGVQFDGRNAAGYFDQEVNELIGSWYFDLGRPTHSFIADIGLLSPEGRFLTLARSNYVMMPRDGVSDIVDEEWLLVDEEFWKLYGFPGGPSSPQLQEMMKTRRMQQITSPGTFSRERIKK
ncbi:MAG: hypothetical protein A2078_02465 [Nitrospirae bacterium GWC2_57_9]|nr:MAG: hypothetical protein A2078_02465 [Nitrospirae bacterium GWC2_57_9]